MLGSLLILPKNSSGDLFLSRVTDQSAKLGLKELSYDGLSVVTTQLNDLFAQDPQKIGKKGIKSIVRKLANVFYSIKAESAYQTKLDAVAQELKPLLAKRRELITLKRMLSKKG